MVTASNYIEASQSSEQGGVNGDRGNVGIEKVLLRGSQLTL